MHFFGPAVTVVDRMKPGGGAALPLFLSLWIGLMGGLMGGLTGCQSKHADGPPPAARLVAGLEASPTNLDPRLATDAYSERIGQLIFSKLVRIGPNLEVIGDLAQRWENPTPTTFRFYLTPGVTFHDGQPLTARDVAYTFGWIMDPKNGSPHRAAYDQISAINVVDDVTIDFVLKTAHAPFLINMARGIVPAHLGDQDGYRDLPVGSGPFKLTRFTPGEAVELAAFESYKGGAPAIKTLVFKIMPEDSVRLLALKKGDIQFLLNGLSPDAVELLEKDPSLVVEHGPGTNYSYLGFNMNDPMLSRLKVRTAIAHAIDRDRIIAALYRGQARPATGMLTPEHWAYEPQVARYAFDPDKARALLDEAGLPDPEGPQPRFSLTYKTSQNELTRRIGEVLQQQLAQVGIEVTVRSYEWGTFYADIKKGNFQLYTLSWVGISEPDIFHYVFHSASTPPDGANRGRFADARVDELVEQGRTTLDRAARKRIYSEVQQILARQLPYVSLWHPESVLVRSAHLHGFTLTPTGDYFSLSQASLEGAH